MRLITLDTVDSTNARAAQLVNAGDLAEDALIVAREQTAGRGTHGRCWHSPRDMGLYMTLVLLRPGISHPVTLDWCHDVTRAAGAACAAALHGEFGVRIGLKPVNDLIIRGCKLGGILTEATAVAGIVRDIRVGVGINLQSCAIPLPSGALPPAFLADHVLRGKWEAPPIALATLLGCAIRDALQRQSVAPCPPSDTSATAHT